MKRELLVLCIVTILAFSLALVRVCSATSSNPLAVSASRDRCNWYSWLFSCTSDNSSRSSYGNKEKVMQSLNPDLTQDKL